MSGAYIQARMDHAISSQPRKVLKAPDRPIAIRGNYIADSRTLLTLRPQGGAQSVAAYKVQDENGATQFTASGRKYNSRSCREFRDASGLPLFELHRKISFRNAWSITLPGSPTADSIATGAPRLAPFGNFIFTFTNVVTTDMKESGDDRLVTLEVERHGRVLESFDIVDGDRKVAEVRESVQHNQKLALTPSTRRNYRPVLDIVVTPGVDLSLVTVLAIIIADSVFGSE
ncbi:tubby C-terminal-like domain-containing protein [Aspergillus pseudotamarii]|uniref:Tubby C-terminal-like domain-containing protein n=1 Tax=Aspergillus pseudotamarii TaxID=132259 RepID=A0A5N6SCU2_ASPPS|nr:tubby C-terminal-like domain-containing protein [Aspergillus pseudotamarii]KAE8130934.1 tubby C-terminal-like domain-containing protein [Aspergillus pseudotamarii]